MTPRTIECLGAVESSQAPVAETIEVYNWWASRGRRRSAWCSLTGSEVPKWTHREKGDVDGFPRTSGASEVDSSMPPANWINKGKLIGRALNLVLGRLQHDLPTCRNGKRQLQDGESVSTFNVQQSLTPPQLVPNALRMGPKQGNSWHLLSSFREEAIGTYRDKLVASLMRVFVSLRIVARCAGGWRSDATGRHVQGAYLGRSLQIERGISQEREPRGSRTLTN